MADSDQTAAVINPARVLLADDSEIVLEVIGGKLAEHGLEVVTCGGGQEALRVAQQQGASFDLIILDVMMPDLNGIDVTAALRSNSTLRCVPILLLTSLEATEDKVRGLSRGADDFLSKTVADVELIARVRSLISLSRLRRELSVREARLVEYLGGEIDLCGEASRTPGSVRGRVLLLHHDALARERALTLLEQTQHLYGVIDGQPTALVDLERINPDLLIISAEQALGGEPPVLAHLRSWRSPPSVLIFDASPAVERRLAAYDAGADDYVAVEMPTSELLARITTLLRRRQQFRQIESARDRAVAAAITDPVTGLYNRGYFEQALGNELQRTRRYQYPTALVLFDIDHFKRINDTYGHAAGDCVLRELARRVGSFVRTTDLAARYGGEEFVLLLPQSSRAQATILAERVRHVLAREPFALPGERASIETITASFGVASVPEDASDARGLLEAADRAMYEAKRAGRNRVQQAAESSPEASGGSDGGESLPCCDKQLWGPVRRRQRLLEQSSAKLSELLRADFDSPLHCLEKGVGSLAEHIEETDPLRPLLGELQQSLTLLRGRLQQASSAVATCLGNGGGAAGEESGSGAA